MIFSFTNWYLSLTACVFAHEDAMPLLHSHSSDNCTLQDLATTFEITTITTNTTPDIVCNGELPKD